MTQRDLIARVKEEMGMGIDSVRVHAWIRAGMPTVPGGKKPRFVWAAVHAWISGTIQDPLALRVRDAMLERRFKVTG